MIFFNKPYKKNSKNKTKLIFDFKIDDELKSVWFEVEKDYEKYLCDDRVDAIVVGMLSYAMRNGHDIVSDSYITEEILYKITNYLIPSLTKYSEKLKPIRIDIKTKQTINNFGGVGTGCSCGIDSIHAYLNNYNRKEKQYKLTHLCINNVGAFNETYSEEGIEKVKRERYKKSIEFAKKVNLPLIITNSNFFEEIPQIHMYTHTYSSCFAILCLQKLWRTYYYGSSGYDLSSFNIKDTSEKDAADYELLSLDCFSTNSLKIYSEGGAYDRLEKTSHVYKSEILKNHLHVCLKKSYNCNVCDKCRRTLLTLYSLDANMEEYNNIFDIDYFQKNIDEYYEWIYKEHLWNSHNMNEQTFNLLLKKHNFKEFIKKYNLEHNINSDKNDYKSMYENIINSKSYKIGNMIMFIPRKLKRIIGGMSNEKNP